MEKIECTFLAVCFPGWIKLRAHLPRVQQDSFDEGCVCLPCSFFSRVIFQCKVVPWYCVSRACKVALREARVWSFVKRSCVLKPDLFLRGKKYCDGLPKILVKRKTVCHLARRPLVVEICLKARPWVGLLTHLPRISSTNYTLLRRIIIQFSEAPNRRRRF